MIKINLLSPADKLNIKWEKTNQLVKNNFFIVILIQIFFVFLFLLMAEYLNFENKNFDKQLNNMELGIEAKEINSIEKELADQNNKLKTFSQIQENQYYWVKIFENLDKIVSSGIRISNISVDIETADAGDKKEAGENFKITINGVSKTIKDLLVFESNLKNSETFFNFSIDPKNYDSENFKYVLLIKKADLTLK